MRILSLSIKTSEDVTDVDGVFEMEMLQPLEYIQHESEKNSISVQA